MKAVALLLGCSALLATPAFAQDTSQAHGSDTLPPANFGTLKQEDIALQVELPGLVLRVLPLSESVIRLLSPDTYGALHRLSEIWAPAIDSAARRRAINRPTVLLVSFFGVQDRVPFNPDDLSVTSRNQLFRPAAILPLSPGWSAGILRQRTTMSALYVFEQVPVLESFSLSYGGTTNDQWDGSLRLLDQERAQVVARAAARH